MPSSTSSAVRLSSLAAVPSSYLAYFPGTGKKYNVLRHRVEPASYSVDQLLLGTIFFTLAAFLFPTVLAYYLAFAAARLAIVALHAGMETVLAFMNHFPLFAVMLRFKDPGRLPGAPVSFSATSGKRRLMGLRVRWIAV